MLAIQQGLRRFFDGANHPHVRSPQQVIRDNSGVVVLVVDVLDLSGSYLRKIRKFVGINPVIVVATKIDLLPKVANFDEIRSWLKGVVALEKVTVVGTVLVSNTSKYGVKTAARVIAQMRRGRDVYIVGAANVGKSSLIRNVMDEWG